MPDYDKTLPPVKLPEAVKKALGKKVDDKKKKFARYNESDAIREALVKDLKGEGYLDKNKEYL